METGLVSVVVPIYKTEKYLDRCLNSIVNQTYRNLEILLIDDGSPDNCPRMCDDWAKKDPRIRVIHKQNQGLGMARNTGIEHATGSYICFFDSDDYIALDTIEKALDSAVQYHSDIVLFGITEVDANGKIQAVYSPYPGKDSYKGSEVLNFLLPNMISGSSKKGKHYNLNMSSCTCLFSMELILRSNWRFVSEREFISEDYYSLLYLYQHVQIVSVLRQACYFYCYNHTSLSHAFRPDRFERICHCYSSMAEVCNELHYSEKTKQCLASQFFGNAIGTMKLIVSSSDHRFPEKRKILKAMVENEALQNALAQIDFATESFGRKVLIHTIKSHSAVLVYWQIKVKALFSER